MRIIWYDFLKMFFSAPIMSFSGKKIFKLENMIFFREKKRSHLFENLFHKNGKAQNMPVVVGRLVLKCSRLSANANDSRTD